MTRRLLPYEHQLIRELGISEQEYLEFAQAQFDHTKALEDKLQTPQAGSEAGVALVLAIIGFVLSAASALFMLLAVPSQKSQRQPREQRFSPRSGFNSVQELGVYGDPVNLVYCNTAQNTTGGVRVATSLVWSAIDSFGSSQFLQMMLVVGAGRINDIDINRLAFGQTPVRQFPSQHVWAYYNPTGRINFSDLKLPVGNTKDPSRDGAGEATLAYRVSPGGSERAEGFSQAFSPSTLTKCGIYSAIPINVNVLDRNDKGKVQTALIGITMDAGFRNDYWATTNRRPIIQPGVSFTLTFESSTITPVKKKDVLQTAAELRRSLFQTLDLASTYKYGSARFRITEFPPGVDLDAETLSVTFTCTERGAAPEEDYETLDYKENETEATDAILLLQDEIVALEALLLTNEPIFLPVEVVSANVEPELNEYLAQIYFRLDALVDYEETQNKIKNFSQISFNPIYPANINLLISAIDINEEQIADFQAGGVTRSEKSKIAQLSKAISNQEKELRTLFIEFFDGSYTATRKERLREIEQLRKDMVSIGATNVSASGGGLDTDAMDTRNQGYRNSIVVKEAGITQQQVILDNSELWNDNFHTKCLVKIEDASYESITECRVIDFALRARVFKRINGRARKYGEKKEPAFKNSDNGLAMRVSMFWMYYRRTAAPESQWNRVSRIFAIRRGQDIDNYISLKFKANDNIGKWQFRFEAIADSASEMREVGTADFAYIENSGPTQVITNPDGTSFSFKGLLKARDGNLPPLNINPAEIDEWSLFSTRSDTQLQFSFDNGPEIEIKAVTEQRVEALSVYPQLYQNLSLLGFNAYSGQGVQDLRSITAFVRQGRLVRQLNDDGSYSGTPNVATSFAPEVFLDTILDPVDGIGLYAKVAGVDLVALAKAKRFCQRNNLFFDGVIADQTPWRQFWAETAAYSLLELGRIGGKETLVPAVPCDNAGNIIRTVPITAMFNAGNILEDSYREEFIDYGSSVQDLIASVIYRETEVDGVFPRNRSVDVSLAGATEVNSIRQTFDLSSYVTNRAQAILFAKYLCQQRRHVRRNIEFRTFPTDSPLSPGSYIYMDVGQQEWQGIYSGQVEAAGVLNIPLAETVPNGTYNVLLYRSGQVVVTQSASIVGSVASSLAGYEGWLFVLGTTVKAKRVFRIIEVQMDEEGEITVRGTEHPCDNAGQSLIADFSDSLFVTR